MIAIFIQTSALIAITFFCGYGFLGLFARPFKYVGEISQIYQSFVYLFGLIPIAVLYSFLGMIGKLNVENFLLGTFLVGLAGINLAKQYSRFIFFKKRLSWPSKFQLLSAVLMSPVLFYGVTISLMPTSNWDVISYVLSIPKTHITEGNVRYLSEYGIFSAFPIYGESLIGFPYLLFRKEQIVQLYIFTFLIALIFIGWRFFSHFSKEKLYALFSIVTVAYLPIVLINLGIAKVEIPQTSLVLASLLLLIKSKEWGAHSKALSAILFTFAIGVKYTTIFYFPIYGLVYWGIYKNQKLKQVAIDLVIFGLIGIAVNSIWLAINLREHCNPLFPNLVNVLGSCSYNPQTISKIMAMVSESTLLQKETSWQSTHSISAYWPFLVNSFGMVNCALLGLIVLIQAVSKKNRNHYPLLKWAQLGIAVIFLFQIFIYYWEFRYFCLVLVLTSIIIFLILDALKISSISRISNLFLVILVLTQALISFRSFYRQNPYVALSYGNYLTQEEYKEKWIHLYWVAQYLNENTASGDVIAFNWGVQPFYYLNRRYFFIHDWNPEGGTQEMVSSSQLLDLLSHKKINYLVWRNQDETRFQEPSITKRYHANMNHLVNDLVRSGKLKPILAKDDVIIYSVLRQ